MTPYAGKEPRHFRWWSAEEMAQLIELRGKGLTRKQIAFIVGRTPSAVKGQIGRNLTFRRPKPAYEWPLPK